MRFYSRRISLPAVVVEGSAVTEHEIEQAYAAGHLSAAEARRALAAARQAEHDAALAYERLAALPAIVSDDAPYR